MKIANTIEQTRDIVSFWRKEGFSVGFVPTMGYLHEGHESLIKRAVKENDKVVVSVFVNPMQFGPNEDFESYPRDFEKDVALCEAAGAKLVFHPSPEEMYMDDFSSYVDVNEVSAGLCGKSRPIHFRGVCTVVCKLFNIVMPDRAYFGEKDAQQLAVVRRMVRDLNLPVEVVGCPIVREEDGLAKSSRNTYLNPEERQAALILSKALGQARRLIDAGEKDADTIRRFIDKTIQSEPLARLDYVEVVDWDGNLNPVATIDGPTLVAVAAYVGKTRLIDNFIIK